MSAQLSHRGASISKKIKVVSFRSDAQGYVPRGKASNKRGYYGEANFRNQYYRV